MKIQDGGGLYIEFQKMSIPASELDETISITFGGQMHHGRIEMMAGTLITLSTTTR